ncbi:hypothetical protein TNCV_2194921 [Trichonephila clavipes]|uniref:Uncharacterized protein n=1 Tax=Trichonephila clavipes TaxID=2585209 RepID=A0A8X6SLS4_TRICX|nr:hypothetical protein TNCV_2194921 [Trichonephila clavipes]
MLANLTYGCHHPQFEKRRFKFQRVTDQSTPQFSKNRVTQCDYGDYVPSFESLQVNVIQLAFIFTLVDRHAIKILLTNIYGRGSLVVKVTDSCPTCHEFQPSTSEDPPCRGVMHVKSIEDQTSTRWCSVEVRRGVPAQVSSSSLEHCSKS